MKRIAFAILFLTFTSFIFAQNNQKRIALVIGNSAYQHGGKLRNPINDANLLANTLKVLGFTVIKKVNADLRTMQIVSAEFKRKIKDYDVALFFYAGHGIQVDGINYLIPIDAKLDDREMTKYDAFNVADINNAFMSNNKNVNIMILDACRNDPFRSWSRGGERGFAKIENSAKGTIIAFATQPGETADDGAGNNGLYTSKLVEQMKISQNIERVFKKTRIEVNKASNGRQVPQDWSSLMADFYFKKGSDKINNNDQSAKSSFLQGKVVYDYGSINIDSKVAGSFYIDDKYKGTIKANSTGNKLTKISIGTHTIKLESDEIWTKTITVYKDQTVKIKVIGGLKKWWDLLDDNWRKIFKEEVPYDKRPNMEQLVQITSIKVLDLKNNSRISSLKPLEKLDNLESLKFSNTDVVNLEAIKSLKNLKELNCANNPIRNLIPLSGLSKLEILDCSNTRIDSLSSIENLRNLEVLKVSGTKIKNLNGIENFLRLKHLEFSRTEVRWLKPIEELNNMKTVKCYDTKIMELFVQKYKEVHPKVNVIY